MEQEPMNENLNSEFFELPPLKDMKEIISEFESSGVADEPSIFKIFNETDLDLENEIESSTSGCDSHLTVKEETLNDDKSEFKIMLNEKDISDIDFEISKDIFDELKIKDEEITGNLEQIIVLENINFKNEQTLPVLPAVKKSEIVMEESMEIIISPEIDETDHIKEENESFESSNSKREIITMLQEMNCDSNISQENTEFLLKEDSINEKQINTIVSSESQESMEIGIKGKEKIENDGNFNEETSKVEKTLIEQKNNEVSTIEKIEEKMDEEYIVSSVMCPVKKEPSISDSIQSVIESVIQASIQQIDNDFDPDTMKEAEESTETRNTLNTIEENSYITRNDKFARQIPIKKKTHGLFEVVVPLIGKEVMKPGNDKPFNRRYDLARERNEQRAKFQQRDPDFPIPNISYQEWRKQKESRSKEQIEKEERDKTVNAIQLATIFTKLAIRILHEYQRDPPNERAMIKYFNYFECSPASPLSLLYAPHFVHTMMLCRGDDHLSPKLRRVTNDCYDKCHALFPIPEGYNFATVFTSEIKKNISDEFDHLDGIELNYGDYDSSDFDDNSPSDSDTDENWE